MEETEIDWFGSFRYDSERMISRGDTNMKFYLAPMEGVTGYVYRTAYHTLFHNVDKYFSPFIVANQHNSFKTRELKDIAPENNQGMYLVPQILTNNSEYFINTSRELVKYGYKEVNLNLGCPASTVVTKGKGSGFLALKDELDQFLYEIFKAQVTEISIKTRIGKDSPDEFYELLQIYNKYPLKELIIHPRIQKDMYKNKPNLVMFQHAIAESKHKIVYNGDIFTKQDYDNMREQFGEVDAMMLGRGILANPGLIDLLSTGVKVDKKHIREFHQKVFADYKMALSADRDVLFKMKELWCYMIHIFSEHEKYAKKIKKADKLSDYNRVVELLFQEQELVDFTNSIFIDIRTV